MTKISQLRCCFMVKVNHEVQSRVKGWWWGCVYGCWKYPWHNSKVTKTSLGMFSSESIYVRMCAAPLSSPAATQSWLYHEVWEAPSSTVSRPPGGFWFLGSSCTCGNNHIRSKRFQHFHMWFMDCVFYNKIQLVLNKYSFLHFCLENIPKNEVS